MKKTVILLAAALFAACQPAIEQKIPEVKVVAFDNVSAIQEFQKDGGSFEADIVANCEWTLTCGEDWITLSKTSGSGNDHVKVDVSSTTKGRSTEVILECVAVPGRVAKITVNQEGGKEISSVTTVTTDSLSTAEGTSAILSASFVSYGVKEEDNLSAGFAIEGIAEDVAATIDRAKSTFSAKAEGLTPGTSYKVKAWVAINGGEKTYGDTTSFVPSKKVIKTPFTVTADFTTNTLWNLPTAITDAVATEKSVTDDKKYTWIISGGAINSGALWLATSAKLAFDGYIILPQLTGKTVTGIDFPNDGPSSSGKARITISVSTDKGASFTPISGCEDVALGSFTLTNQPEGAIYKITNVKVSAGGYSKTTALTIHAE